MEEFPGGRRSRVKRVFEENGGFVYELRPKEVEMIVRCALRFALARGVTSANSVYDIVHLVTAKFPGLGFVSSERRVCSWARALFVQCLQYYKKRGRR